jgi:hypothetical protein
MGQKSEPTTYKMTSPITRSPDQSGVDPDVRQANPQRHSGLGVRQANPQA